MTSKKHDVRWARLALVVVLLAIVLLVYRCAMEGTGGQSDAGAAGDSSSDGGVDLRIPQTVDADVDLQSPAAPLMDAGSDLQRAPSPKYLESDLRHPPRHPVDAGPDLRRASPPPDLRKLTLEEMLARDEKIHFGSRDAFSSFIGQPRDAGHEEKIAPYPPVNPGRMP